MVTIDELRVVLSGQNEALKRAVRDSETALDRLGKTAEASNQRAGANFQALADNADKMGAGVNRAMGVMTRLDLVQITVEQSAERVRQAQEKYTQAVEDFGPGSRQAVEAQRELNNAQTAAEKTNLRARASYGLVAVEVIGLAAKIPLLIVRLQAMGAAALATRAAMVGLGAGILIAGAFAARAITSLAKDFKGLDPAKDSIAELNDEVNRLQGELNQIDTNKFLEGTQKVSRGIVELGTLGAAKPGETLGEAQKRLEQDLAFARARRDALIEDNARLLKDFESFERKRLLLAQGTEEEIQESIAGTEASMRQLRAAIQTASDPAQRQALLESYGAELAFLDQLTRAHEQRAAAGDAAALEAERHAQEAADEAQRLADEAQRAADEAERLRAAGLAADFDAIGDALGSAGIRLEDFTIGMQRTILAAGGLTTVERGFLAAQEAEAGLLREALRLNPALLDQVEVTRRKGETNEELAKRLGLTTDQEAELLRTGRLVEEGILSQAEAQRRLAEGQGGGFTFGQNLPPMFRAQHGFDGVVREPTLFLAGERGDESVRIAPVEAGPRAGGGATVSVTVQRIEFQMAPTGRAFDPERAGEEIGAALTRVVREAFP